jgi:hypothetical protein
MMQSAMQTSQRALRQWLWATEFGPAFDFASRRAVGQLSAGYAKQQGKQEI